MIIRSRWAVRHRFVELDPEFVVAKELAALRRVIAVSSDEYRALRIVARRRLRPILMKTERQLGPGVSSSVPVVSAPVLTKSDALVAAFLIPITFFKVLWQNALPVLAVVVIVINFSVLRWFLIGIRVIRRDFGHSGYPLQ
jgi:hypothetical protein